MTEMDRSTQKSTSERLANMSEKIMRCWEEQVLLAAPSAARQSESPLRDSLPKFLSCLSNALNPSMAPFKNQEDVNQKSENHGRQRAGLVGYPLPQRLAEYRILRQIIFTILEEEGGTIPSEERDIILDSIEEGMISSATFFIENAANVEQRFSVATHVSKIGVWDLNLKTGDIWRSENHDRAYGFEKMLPEWNLTTAKKSFHPEDLARFEEKLAKSIEEISSWSDIIRTIWPDGSVHWMCASGRVIADEHGKPNRIMGTNWDVTEEVEAKHKLDRLITELQTERDLRDRFVATLTHDLRTPLTAAEISAQLIRKRAAGSKEIERPIERVIANIDRLDRMILDLLDVSRLRSGEPIPLHMQKCSLNDLIGSTLKNLSAIYGQRFYFDSPERVTGSWSADAIQRILENLCNNAIKYGTAESPVTVSGHDPNRWTLSLRSGVYWCSRWHVQEESFPRNSKLSS